MGVRGGERARTQLAPQEEGCEERAENAHSLSLLMMASGNEEQPASPTADPPSPATETAAAPDAPELSASGGDAPAAATDETHGERARRKKSHAPPIPSSTRALITFHNLSVPPAPPQSSSGCAPPATHPSSSSSACACPGPTPLPASWPPCGPRRARRPCSHTCGKPSSRPWTRPWATWRTRTAATAGAG